MLYCVCINLNRRRQNRMVAPEGTFWELFFRASRKSAGLNSCVVTSQFTSFSGYNFSFTGELVWKAPHLQGWFDIGKGW